MNSRIFVEKRAGFQVEAQSLLHELNENLSLHLTGLRYLNVYDVFGISVDLVEKCKYAVFGEKVTDKVTLDPQGIIPPVGGTGRGLLAIEPLPGQFDQRASSAVDCVHLIDPTADVQIKSARLVIFEDPISEADLARIRHYMINAVESREKDMDAPLTAPVETRGSCVSPIIEGFTAMQPSDYAAFCKSWGLAMNTDDLHCVVEYFTKEQRNPTETELRILDTYWSDHCRHTTFTTELETIKIDDSFLKNEIESTLGLFHDIRKELGRENKSLCLMELATIGGRYLRAIGKLDDMEVSEENNACSIFVDVDVDGQQEKWLLQFKNETHNHPTEIEPFGGASTCLGGAIRDPLSGRAYVYQAMRVTGAGDIYLPVRETLNGKLPQRIISRKAAAGYSSYGNQIGLATTHVREIYHPSYVAKRLEVGAVVGAVKAENVRRESPSAGDIILLLGGRTGRDGIGGATGSSKEHTEESLETCGSEVQKGNAPVERDLQRLFRRPEVTKLIKKSNDFGAGGVSVAIGELADGLDIYLDRVPTKYSGLNPTELAISESQERMAVVIEAHTRADFEAYCAADNVEVTYVADVTDTARMRLFYKGETIADLTREFIDSAGAKHYASATIGVVENAFPNQLVETRQWHVSSKDLQASFVDLLSSPNVTSQKGLIEMFDATIGRSTVLMPFGGKYQATETQVSVQKLPTNGVTHTASILSFGYNPFISEWSPYHGAAYAVIEACAKNVAAGGDYSKMRFSYQEYFERMTSEHSYGKPLAALLGALKMQVALGLPSIGGKDSMSGTFGNISVPPTLIAFGVNTAKDSDIISPEFKAAGNRLYLLKHRALDNHMPNTEQLQNLWNYTHEQILNDTICSAYALGFGGLAEALAKCSFGNRLGANIRISENLNIGESEYQNIGTSDLFAYDYGSILVETTTELDNSDAIFLGEVINDYALIINGEHLDGHTLEHACTSKFDTIYPSTSTPSSPEVNVFSSEAVQCSVAKRFNVQNEHPLVFIPIFPGTNCDYDSAKAWRKAGAEVETMVFRNLTSADVLSSIDEMEERIARCQILMLAGGFSAGDEPDGSGKFIASVLNNTKIAAAIDALIARGGLILGICNGFQALIKSGLLPNGELTANGEWRMANDQPTLFRNDINRHISQMVTTRVESTNSPWLSSFAIGDTHAIAMSHGEGKFVVSEEFAKELFANGQVAFRYADPDTGEATMQSPFNPNGSSYAIEGIISKNGQILGKMGHSERYEEGLFKNIHGNREQQLFENAVAYFYKK